MESSFWGVVVFIVSELLTIRREEGLLWYKVCSVRECWWRNSSMNHHSIICKSSNVVDTESAKFLERFILSSGIRLRSPANCEAQECGWLWMVLDVFWNMVVSGLLLSRCPVYRMMCSRIVCDAVDNGFCEEDLAKTIVLRSSSQLYLLSQSKVGMFFNRGSFIHFHF